MSQKIKLSIVTPTLDGGGAEHIFILLADSLQKMNPERLDVTLVALSGSGVLRDKVPAAVHFVDLKAKRTRNALFSLRRYLVGEKPDVVLSILQASALISLLLPTISHRPKHVIKLTNHFTYTCEALGGLAGWLFSRAVRSADKIVAMSDAAVPDVVKKAQIPVEKVIKINNPIDIDSVVRAAGEIPTIQLAHPSVIMSGRLTRQKGYPDAIHAWRQVLKKVPDAHLYILGEGTERESLENLIRNLSLEDSVTLLGFNPNPHNIVRQADVFLLTSLWEGFGNVLVEAMVVGTSIVATDCPSGPREILKKGECGKLVMTGSHIAIAEGLATLLIDIDLRKKYAVLARQRAVDFNVNKISELYLDMITKVK